MSLYDMASGIVKKTGDFGVSIIKNTKEAAKDVVETAYPNVKEFTDNYVVGADYIINSELNTIKATAEGAKLYQQSVIKYDTALLNAVNDLKNTAGATLLTGAGIVGGAGVDAYRDAKETYGMNPIGIVSGTRANVYEKLNKARHDAANATSDYLRDKNLGLAADILDREVVVYDTLRNTYVKGWGKAKEVRNQAISTYFDTAKKVWGTAIDVEMTGLKEIKDRRDKNVKNFIDAYATGVETIAGSYKNAATKAYDALTGAWQDTRAAVKRGMESASEIKEATADTVAAAAELLTNLGEKTVRAWNNGSSKTEKDNGTRKVSYILPGAGEQLELNESDPRQGMPLLRYYSPRLFGAPPQLTNQCDMRIRSSYGQHPGAVGDFYLSKILQDAQLAYFAVGRARFIGGFSSIFNFLHQVYWYGTALKKYNIFGSDDVSIIGGNRDDYADIVDEEAYKTAYGTRDDEEIITKTEGNSTVLDMDLTDGVSLLEKITSTISTVGTSLYSALKTSLSVQQPFYTYEADWPSYINNVKMMINTAVIMLGLQNACVREGDYYYPINMKVKFDKTDSNDVWANYRYITLSSSKGAGDVLEKNTDTGETTQYVTFMIDPASVSENVNNEIGQSQIYSSVINSGSSVGSEIAFITNSTAGSTSDKVINLSKESKSAAEDILKNLSSGNGRFTAAIASSMARSFTGDHTIYPEVFQGHSATSSMSMTIHLTSDAGDPYSYLINILVPTFFILGMALPQMSKDNASAYSYPPIVQCNIPGMWGTRLGMIESVTFNKNPHGKDVSINGYPLQVDVTINVKDLQHVLVTSPMNDASMFLNNQTMFDYIAQISGVDRYKSNGAMRTIARLALAASALNTNNLLNNVGDTLLSDWHSWTNRVTAWDRR